MTFNRTIVELKYVWLFDSFTCIPTFNRTIVELKFYISKSFYCRSLF